MIQTVLAPLAGATLENFFRQPLTALTTVMIQEKKPFFRVAADTYRLGGIKLFFNGPQGFLISWGSRSLHRVSTFCLNDTLSERKTPLWVSAPMITLAEVATTTLGELALTIAQKDRGSSPIAILQNRVRAQGFSSLSTGCGGNLGRNLIFNTVVFGLKNGYSVELAQSPVLGSVCVSALAVIASHPAEVVRMHKVDMPNISYAKHFQAIMKNGVSELFRGLGPRMASTGIGTAITLSTVSWMQKDRSFGPVIERKEA